MSDPAGPLESLLQAGIAAARAGDAAGARACLIPVVQADERNVRAWYWLSRVVESADDRQVCLENVLALDPGHGAVAAELGALRAEAAEQRGIERDVQAAVPATPEEQLISDAAVQPLPCPYCGAAAGALDRRCARCHAALWVRERKTKDHSVYSMGLVLGWLFQANYIWLGLVLFYLGANVACLLRRMPGTAAALDTVLGLAGLPDVPLPGADLPIWPVLVVGGLAFSFSLVVAAGLWFRARFFYWLAVGLIILGFAALMAHTFLAEELMLGRVILNSGLFLIVMAFVFMAHDDFAWIERRVAAVVDPDVDSDAALYMRGRDHADRGMWARAAVHWSRAVAQNPGQPDYRLALASAYVNLERPELAAEHLAAARRIDPANPQLVRIEAAAAMLPGAPGSV